MRYYNKEARRLSDLCDPYYYLDKDTLEMKLSDDAPQHIKIADKKWKKIHADIEEAIMKDWGCEVIRRG